MKLSTVVMGIGLGAFALVGCSADTVKTAAEKIVGKWHKGCYHPSTAEFRYTQDLDFNATHVTRDKKSFALSDNNCTGEVLNSKKNTHPYTIGAATKTADGKDAVEFDKTWDGGGYYSIIQFDGNDKMNIAWEEGDCQTEETRCKTIGENWTWFIRQ